MDTEYPKLFRLAANYIYDQAIDLACPALELYFIYTIIREGVLYIKNCGRPTEKLKAKCYEISKLTEKQCTGRLDNLIVKNGKNYYSAQSIATLVFICSLDIENKVPAEHYGADCSFDVCSNAGHYIDLIDWIVHNASFASTDYSTLDKIAEDLLKKCAHPN